MPQPLKALEMPQKRASETRIRNGPVPQMHQTQIQMTQMQMPQMQMPQMQPLPLPLPLPMPMLFMPRSPRLMNQTKPI